MLESILKILFIGFMSAVKFITAAPLASAYGFGYFETLLITSIGGIIGVSVFFLVSKAAIKAVFKAKEKLQHQKEHELELAGIHPPPAKKRIFTWKNKMIVKTVRRFGLAGIALITPVVLSIPLGTFIAFRYFHNKKKVYAYLSLAVLFWSIILSSLTLIF
jgi:hypothetical protein